MGGGGRAEAPISARSLEVMSAVASRAWWRRFRRLRGVDVEVEVGVAVVVGSEAGGWSYCPFTVPHQLAALSSVSLSQMSTRWLHAYSQRSEGPRIRHDDEVVGGGVRAGRMVSPSSRRVR